MTRRIFIPAAVLLSVLLIFFSCKSQKGSETGNKDILDQVSQQYDTTANITYGDLSATASISQATPLSCDVKFSEPSSLQDMAFTFTQDNVEVSYKGLSFAFDPSSVPGSAVANMAVSAINKVLQKDGVEVRYTDGAVEVSGATEAGDFILLLDPENGNLLKLSIPGEQLEIEFENFTFLG